MTGEYDQPSEYYGSYHPGSVTEWNLRYYNKSVYLRLTERDKSEIAQKLNAFRLALVRKYIGSGRVLDFGIGAGTFLKLHGNCLGYDINPYAVAILKKRGLYFDPYNESLSKRRIKGVTFFDSLEHIESPQEILKRIGSQHVFISTPIFYTTKHMMTSKHFKPNEHAWHFMAGQFRTLMESCGFKVLEDRRDETYIGRTDIRTYVLKRTGG
jgi:SAM-dependent methyltransferase